VRTFFGQGERDQFFAIFCGRILWTASKKMKLVANLHKSQ